MRKTAIISLMSLVLILSALVIVGTSSALAAKGGNKGGNSGGGSGTEATIEANPSNSGEGGANYFVTGTGFSADVATFVIVTGDGYNKTVLIRTDDSGSFALAWNFEQSGNYTFQACQYSKKKGGSWTCGLGMVTINIL